MQHSESIRYLERAGFRYKATESPELWNHLESRFAVRPPVGPRFAPMPANLVAELIAMGEEALLEAFVTHHRSSGSPGRVERIIDLPYVVGTGAAILRTKANASRMLRLIEQPGTPQERVVHVMPAAADDIPCISRMTVTGGLYADGHTAGYYDLRPGEGPDKKDAVNMYAYLATPDEIASLAREMEEKVEDIEVVTRRECGEMIAKAKKLLSK